VKITITDLFTHSVNKNNYHFNIYLLKTSHFQKSHEALTLTVLYNIKHLLYNNAFCFADYLPSNMFLW